MWSRVVSWRGDERRHSRTEDPAFFLRPPRATGEVIRVTDRGEVVAELRPPSSAHRVPVELAGLHELASRGTLRLGRSNKGMRYPRSPVRLSEGAAKATLDAEREDSG